MCDHVLSVKDQLAAVTADIDQAQALIDEARSKFPNDLVFQKNLDEAQSQLDLKRERVRFMREINDMLS